MDPVRTLKTIITLLNDLRQAPLEVQFAYGKLAGSVRTLLLTGQALSFKPSIKSAEV